MNFYKHHLGDYAAATSHLSWDEDCAYRRLIDQYYKREAPLPVDLKDVCRLARASTPAQRRAVDIVLREFFTLEDDGWHQKRCDSEIGAASAQADTNRRIAVERESKRRQRNEHDSSHAPSHDSSSLRAESVNLARLQTPDSSNQTPNTKPPNPPSGGEPDGFAEFWSAYPRKTAKPAALRAFRAQRINGKLPDILADVDRRKHAPEWAKDGGQFIPHPATYLTQRRWEDGPDLEQVSTPNGPAKPPKSESFAERDRRAGMERWEQMTGRKHPELERLRGNAGAEIIDSMPLERIAHEPADQGY